MPAASRCIAATLPDAAWKAFGLAANNKREKKSIFNDLSEERMERSARVKERKMVVDNFMLSISVG